jgi:hypothetical protein
MMMPSRAETQKGGRAIRAAAYGLACVARHWPANPGWCTRQVQDFHSVHRPLRTLAATVSSCEDCRPSACSGQRVSDLAR